VRQFLKQPGYRSLIIIFLLGAIISFGEARGLFNPLKGLVEDFTIPVQISLYSASRNVKNTLSTVKDIGNLRDENAKLSEEAALLTAESVQISLLKEQNSALRKQIRALPTEKENLVVADVIGLSPFVSNKLLLIDKGEKSGLRKGMVVVLQNILLGRIYQTTPRTANVQLVSDPQTKISAVTSRKVHGIVQGQFGAEILLTNVVQGDTLKVGDLVMTTGEDNLPSSLVIGKVSQVKSVQKELFQKAVVTPLILYENLTSVFVLTEK